MKIVKTKIIEVYHNDLLDQDEFDISIMATLSDGREFLVHDAFYAYEHKEYYLDQIYHQLAEEEANAE